MRPRGMGGKLLSSSPFYAGIKDYGCMRTCGETSIGDGQESQLKVCLVLEF